jgi:CheY-like chemotaxis protein
MDDCLDNSRISGLKVLLIDNEPDALDLLESMLAQYGANTIIATSAMEGFNLVATARPDIIIADIGMPEKDGYQFMQEVRNLPPQEGGATPAIALTAFAHPEDRKKAIRSGYQAHLSKPFEYSELLAAIENLTCGLPK